ncbi:hypothetical protein CVT25_004851, partial [Psilocybe cyanescens]
IGDNNRYFQLLATLLNSGAYGVLTVQAFLYHLAFSAKDSIRLRATVYGIYTLETIQTMMVGRTVFDIYVLGFLNPQSTDEVRDLWFSVPIIGGLVQAFYARRILIFGQFISHYRLTAGAVLVVRMEGDKGEHETQSANIRLSSQLSVLQLASTIVTSVELAQDQFWSRVWGRNSRLPFLIWNASGATCDLTIACSMTYMSSKLSYTKPEYKKTRVLVKKLIRLTVETGVLTAFVALLNIILVVAPTGHSQYYQITSALLSKMYANTIMVILNSRMSIIGLSKWDTGEEDILAADLIFASAEQLDLTLEES